MVLKNVALFIAYNFILFSITLSKSAKKSWVMENRYDIYALFIDKIFAKIWGYNLKWFKSVRGIGKHTVQYLPVN